eukprot:scaffold1774_cov121-Isochrysis_galbana.AAC.2
MREGGGERNELADRAVRCGPDDPGDPNYPGDSGDPNRRARGERILLRAGRVAHEDAAARAWEHGSTSTRGRLRARRAVIWVRFPSLPSLPRVPPEPPDPSLPPRDVSGRGIA